MYMHLYFLELNYIQLLWEFPMMVYNNDLVQSNISLYDSLHAGVTMPSLHLTTICAGRFAVLILLLYQVELADYYYSDYYTITQTTQNLCPISAKFIMS
jgi:hypothetical protein